MQFHRDLITVKCDIQLPNAVFMGIQLAGFFCAGGTCGKKDKGGWG